MIEPSKREIDELKMAELIRPSYPVIIYGAGALGKIAIEKLKTMEIEIVGVCDSNCEKFGTDFEGYTIQPFEKMISKLSNKYQVVIAVGETYYVEVKNYLLKFLNESEFYKLNVFECPSVEISESYKKLILDNYEICQKVADLLEDDLSKKTFYNVIKGRVTFDADYFNSVYDAKQYFNELTQESDDEYFIDAGAYIGDTLRQFIEFKQNKFKYILSLEPFEECFEELKMMVISEFDGDKRIEIEKKALSNQNETIKINQSLGASNSITRAVFEESQTVFEEIETICLDDLNLEKVTFIKMDIEGSELDALNGAVGTIRRFTPKLAICVYHKPEDIFVIPNWIQSLNLNYKYYMRHHGNPNFNQHCETVFYAVPY